MPRKPALRLATGESKWGTWCPSWSRGKSHGKARWSCAVHILTLGRTDLLDNRIAWPPGLPSFRALSNQNEQWQHLAFEAAAGSLSGHPSLLSPSLRPAHREGEPLHSPTPVTLLSCALPPQLDSPICERKSVHLVLQAGFYCLWNATAYRKQCEFKWVQAIKQCPAQCWPSTGKPEISDIVVTVHAANMDKDQTTFRKKWVKLPKLRNFFLTLLVPSLQGKLRSSWNFMYLLSWSEAERLVKSSVVCGYAYMCVYIQQWNIIMEYYSASKKGNLSFVTTQVNLEDINAKYNKPDMERKVLHSLIYLWNLKKVEFFETASGMMVIRI